MWKGKTSKDIVVLERLWINPLECGYKKSDHLLPRTRTQRFQWVVKITHASSRHAAKTVERMDCSNLTISRAHESNCWERLLLSSCRFSLLSSISEAPAGGTLSQNAMQHEHCRIVLFPSSISLFNRQMLWGRGMCSDRTWWRRVPWYSWRWHMPLSQVFSSRFASEFPPSLPMNLS